MLSVYSLNESEKWDQIVHSFKEYDAYYLSGYVKAFKIHGDGEPLLFYYEDESVRGINVVMRRDIAKCRNLVGKLEEGKYFDFATPYGYGGWMIEGEKTEKLFQKYGEWCKENSIISEFVRFHPMVGNAGVCKRYYEVVGLGEVVHMELSSPEFIWENIVSQNRNKIRKAIKNGIKIYNGRYPEIYEKFRLIYNGTMDKDNAANYYYFGKEFYKSIMEDLPQNAQIFYAVKDDIVVAAAIMLAVNGRMNYHLSGSVREYCNLAPTNLLLYEAALWGWANGCRTLYLGGGVGSEEDGLFKFKRSFYKGELNRFYIGKKIYGREVYEELLDKSLKEGKEMGSRGFFPGYREEK